LSAEHLVKIVVSVFTALHGMQTRSSDLKAVCHPSVCLSVYPSVRQTHVLWQNGRKICPDFLYQTKDHLS